jgi:nucleotide-binding universal stress UspA family protein
MMKILVAIDGSPTSLRALAYVTEKTGLFSANCDITLINIHLPIPSPRAKAWVGKDVVDEYYSSEADNAFADAIAYLNRVGRVVNIIKCVGEPAHEIALAADDGFSMIVMGTHGRTALGNLVMGSVAMRTIAEATVPVLLVK